MAIDDQFSLDLSRFLDGYEGDMDQRVRAICFQLTEGIINRTPVDEGTLRNNWQATVTSPARGTLSEKADAAAVLAKAQPAISKAPGNDFYLTNNLPYARVAEFGEWSQGPQSTSKTTAKGFSKQAPRGMVRVTIAELRSALRRLSNRG